MTTARVADRVKTPGFGREAVLLIVLIGLIIAMAQASPLFLTLDNLLDTSRYFVETGLIALGMTLVIITGGIDVSVGSTLALASVTIGFTYQAGVPLIVAVVLGVLVGTACGIFNGVLTAVWDMHPLAITIATLSFFRGIAIAITNENAVSSFPNWFGLFGQGAVGQVPNQLFVFVVAAVIVWFVLHRTVLGRRIFALGLSQQVARFSAVRTVRIKVFVYAITGLLAGIAAVIYTSRVSTARSDAGTGLELQVIAAVVLGGASVRGGAGSIGGTILGLLIISVLNQGLLLTSINSNWTLVIIGAVMIVGVFINEFFRRRQE
jgi:rhamnose transport system permease protein